MERQTKQGVSADAIDIMKILPHRYPMLLIDAVLEYEAGSFAVARKTFSYNEAYLQGHYPKQPIVPGTVLLEGLSQAAAFAILSGRNGGADCLLFTGVSRLRFFRAIFPGDCVVYRAEVIKNRHGLWTVKGEGESESQICISAEITFISKNDI